MASLRKLSRGFCICVSRGAHQGISRVGAKFSANDWELGGEIALAGVPRGGHPAKGLLQHVPQICAIDTRLPSLHCCKHHVTRAFGVERGGVRPVSLLKTTDLDN